MYRMLPAFAVALLLSAGWWGTVSRATTAALGLDTPAAAEQQTSPSPSGPRDGLTTDGGCAADPDGRCGH
jgi:hypothetical protein